MSEERLSDAIDGIMENLYSTFGTDSGVLFGISDRQVVEAIVRQTLMFEHEGVKQ